jgi:uncharacterized Tic20 family protein
MNNTPSTEERVWAVISHLSAVALGIGILLPIFGWSEQRRKSRYASFQSLQALGYQSLGYTLWLLTALVVIIFQSFALVRDILSASESGEDPTIWLTSVATLHSAVLLVLIGLYLLLPVWAAIASALGRDFRYPFMGNRLARYLGYGGPKASAEQNWLIEDHEDRWVAAMGHFTVIIVLWGMLAPLTSWLLQGRRGYFLKFQSMQTLVYQALVTLLFFSTGFFYLAGIVAFAVTIGFSGGVDFDSATAVIGIVIFGLSLLLTIAIILIVPLLHIQGQWAGYRTLKGDDYRYPLVGRLVERWMKKANSKVEEKAE